MTEEFQIQIPPLDTFLLRLIDAKEADNGREPWSSGYGKRLTNQRSWVQIPAPYTGWTFFTSFVVKICGVCFKRPKINGKRPGLARFFKKRGRKLPIIEKIFKQSWQKQLLISKVLEKAEAVLEKPQNVSVAFGEDAIFTCRSVSFNCHFYSVTRFGDLLHFGQLFKACGNNYFAQISYTVRQFS